MGKEIADRGNSFTVNALDRAFGGKETEVFRISGGGLNTITGTTETLGDVRIVTGNGSFAYLNGSPLASAGGMLFTGAAGVAAAGPVTLAGTKVGDKVVGVIDITTAAVPVSAASSFESTITVAGQIQQSSASDLHTHGFLFLIVHAS